MTNKQLEQITKIRLANSLLNVIFLMVEQREDWSRIMLEYNDLIDMYDLPLRKIAWVSLTEYEFI